MKHNNWMRLTMGLALLVLFTAGCSLMGSNQDKQAIDPPLIYDTEDADSAATIAEADQSIEMLNLTMYYKDPNGFVAPVSMHVPKVVGVAKEALRYMVAGGPEQGMLPQGFTALLPEGTEVIGLDIRPDKLAIVDFNEAFGNYDPADERKIMEAITWTLTDFDTVTDVELRIQGEKLSEMPVAGTPLDEPMSRVMGINVERGGGVMLSQSSPVNLYFQSQTGDYSYIVPVTRLIERTAEPAQAAIEQLIAGPMSEGLVPVMLPDVQIIDVEKGSNDQVVIVNLSDELLGPDQKVASETLRSVVLSVMDSAGASQVQVMVSGSEQVFSTEDENYSFPVNRPDHINPYEA